ncbi:reverse transcriptase domain-containing protein [Actinacidiphila glaucinigra]|uniref:RNA-directed DNA polymerase n=1 Tax=Actinacidiphila glaucinigra TaxID=235986 RepID=UPI0037B43030
MADPQYLDLAARRLFAIESRRELPDIINFSDVKASWRRYRDEMLRHLHNPHCGPDRVELIEHPKDPLSVRPLARFGVKDRLTYESLIFQVSSIVDSKISDNVFSYRARRTSIHSVQDWLDMRHHAREVLNADESLIMARTDVTAFYEHVALDILSMDLSRAGVSDALLNKVLYFLQRFQEQSRAWGLPQGSSASGVLANVYLAPVDEVIRQSAVRHVRYSDDMYLFGDDREHLRSSLLTANQALRGRRLSMSATKTHIYGRDKALDHLDDAEKDLVSYFYYLGSEWAKKTLADLFLEASQKGNERDIKFSLTRFGKKRDEIALTWALENVKNLHHLSDQILRYAERFPRHSENLRQCIERVIIENNLADYPYLERNLLHAALRARIESGIIKDHAWQVLKNQNRSNYPREFAARYIGRYASMPDGPILKMQYESEESEPVQRALIISLYEADYIPPQLLTNLSRSGSELRWTAAYLLRSPDVPLPS